MATSKRTAARLHLLTAREVQNARKGDHADGGGLLLRVSDAGCSWVLRYTSPSGRRREMGLGVAHRGSTKQAGETLDCARQAVHRARELLRNRIDPIDARDDDRDAMRKAEEAKKAERAIDHWTLKRCARDYHERVIEPTKTTKHAAQWISSLENHGPPTIWNKAIGAITPPELLTALLDVKPHERARNLKSERVQETVRRLRQRLDAIFEDAIFHERSNIATVIMAKTSTLPIGACIQTTMKVAYTGTTTTPMSANVSAAKRISTAKSARRNGRVTGVTG